MFQFNVVGTEGS